jgi:hypothetical protein
MIKRLVFILHARRKARRHQKVGDNNEMEGEKKCKAIRS